MATFQSIILFKAKHTVLASIKYQLEYKMYW